MSVKIELPDEVYAAARDKIGFSEDVGAIFNGILEAMVKCGMASLVEQSGEPYIKTMTPAVTYPYIIIRLVGGKN